MPGFNGAGVFERTYDWTDDQAAGTKVRADRMDTEMDGFATGLSNCICRDGQSTITANIPMNSKKLTGLAAGSSAGDSVRYEQVGLLAVANTFSVAGAQTIKNTSDSASVQVAAFHGDRATMADNDEAYISLMLSDDGGTQTEMARLKWVATDVSDTTEDGELYIGLMTAGSLADELRLSATYFAPATSDGLALGTTSLMWADAFLALGAVINWNNSDVTLTHAANALTFAGATTYTFDGTIAGAAMTLSGALTVTGAVALNGGGVLGDAAGDAVTIKGTVVNSFMSGMLASTGNSDFMLDLNFTEAGGTGIEVTSKAGELDYVLGRAGSTVKWYPVST